MYLKSIKICVHNELWFIVSVVITKDRGVISVFTHVSRTAIYMLSNKKETNCVSQGFLCVIFYE
jgi:hypothetical protein